MLSAFLPCWSLWAATTTVLPLQNVSRFSTILRSLLASRRRCGLIEDYYVGILVYYPCNQQSLLLAAAKVQAEAPMRVS